MKCLSCGSEMKTVVIEGIEIDVCPNCGGMWFDEDELVKLAELDTDAFQGVEEILTPPEKAPSGQTPGYTGRKCPRCGAPLFSHYYGGNSDIVIDTCEQCGGVWLDGGEFMKIVNYLKETKKPLSPEELALISNIMRESRDRIRRIEEQAPMGIFKRIAMMFRRKGV